MKFCQYLLRDINFEPNAIQPCCDIHSLGVPAFPFSGGVLDVDAYKKHLSVVFWRLQDSTDICSGCSHLNDADISFAGDNCMDIGRYMNIRTVSFNQHRFFCNCRCVYCSLWEKQNKTGAYSVLPAVKALVASSVVHDKCSFSWGGGEPCILKEFDEVCSWLQQQNYFQYVHTSALRYSDAVANLLQSGSGRVNISLDSGSRQKYQEIKGVDGWQKVLATLGRYIAAAVSTSQIDLKYIIFEQTNQIREIAAFLDLCNRLSIFNVQYSLDFREINNNTISLKTLSAAAFFRRRSCELGLTATPFFIDQSLLEKIGKLETQL